MGCWNIRGELGGKRDRGIGRGWRSENACLDIRDASIWSKAGLALLLLEWSDVMKFCLSLGDWAFLKSSHGYRVPWKTRNKLQSMPNRLQWNKTLEANVVAYEWIPLHGLKYVFRNEILWMNWFSSSLMKKVLQVYKILCSI